MDNRYVIEAKNIKKEFGRFSLDIDELNIPAGYATALIGENGAGKSTLLNILAGIRLDYKGSIRYFEKYDDTDRENNPVVKENIGYTGPGTYYFSNWTISNIIEISKILFKSFSAERFRKWCDELAIVDERELDKKISTFSDGNIVKLMLAGVLARDTRLLLLDEPASPLDPLMREKLCDMIGDYISAENGKTRGNAGNAGNREDGENRENAENKGNIDLENIDLENIDLENINLNRSVLFSTHNVSDMESITDYAIIMDDGRILERGFVEDLKEKYVYVHAEPEDSDKVKPCFVSYSESKYGIEGLALTEDAAKFSDLDITAEIPTLYQISVGVMKTATKLKIR